MNVQEAKELGDALGVKDTKAHPFIVPFFTICLPALVAWNLPIHWALRIIAFFALASFVGFCRTLWPVIFGLMSLDERMQQLGAHNRALNRTAEPRWYSVLVIFGSLLLGPPILLWLLFNGVHQLLTDLGGSRPAITEARMFGMFRSVARQSGWEDSDNQDEKPGVAASA